MFLNTIATIIWLTDLRAVIGQFQVRKWPYEPLALDYLSKRQIISFFSRNNQQSHIINILLASFARSVPRQVMDPVCAVMNPCFSFPFLVFMVRARGGWAIKGRKKNSFHNLPYGPRTRLIRGKYWAYSRYFPFLQTN